MSPVQLGAEDKSKPDTRPSRCKCEPLGICGRIVYVEVGTDGSKTNNAGEDQGKERSTIGSDRRRVTYRYGMHVEVSASRADEYQDDEQLRDIGISDFCQYCS